MSKLLFLCLCVVGFVYAGDISGIYAITHKNDISYVEMFKRNSKFYAVGFANKSGNPSGKDVKNPNDKLRNRDIRGTVFLWGLTKKDDKEYSGGKIYNFGNGNEYYVNVKVENNGLKVRASKDSTGVFGKSILWKKVSEQEIAPFLDKRINLDRISIPE